MGYNELQEAGQVHWINVPRVNLTPLDGNSSVRPS